MMFLWLALVALTRLAPASGALAVARTSDGGDNPVTKVVKLLEEMKKQVETESKEDEEIYDKMACWCETNEKEKTAAIKFAETKIEELSAFIEEGTAHAAQLTSEIAQLKEDIAAIQESIDKAVAIREEEKAEFEEEEKFMMDTLTALKSAIAVLKKVQLLQKKGDRSPAIDASLVQVRKLVSQVSTKVAMPRGPRSASLYQSVMQKDLWDILGMLPGVPGAGGVMAPSPRVITGLDQEEQPTGLAAGAQSYASRSSSIFGILEQMQDTFNKDLEKAHRTEIAAEISFQKLRSAKEGEMQAAAAAMEEKSAELADINAKVAQAKEDLELTKEALANDQKFLAELKDSCAKADKEYGERQKTRMEEISAIASAISILSEDDARDVFSKSLSFLQVRRAQRAQRRGPLGLLLAQTGSQDVRRRAAAQLLALSKRMGHGSGSGSSPAGWRLAMLAVGVQIDGFEKVKALMDKMIAELKTQQAEEVTKHDTCVKDIDTNEDNTMVKETEKKDVEGTIAGLEGTIAQLEKDLEDLKASLAEAQVMLKRAGEDRHAENKEFQQVVADQRIMIKILSKALSRLQAFYGGEEEGKASLLARRQDPVPGAAVAPPPPAGKNYEQSQMASGVVQMLMKIIQEAEIADKEAVMAEQSSQAAYAELVANTNSEMTTMNTAITEKTIAHSQAEADLIEAKKALKAVERALEDLHGENLALHQACDYILKNFMGRQQARGEEIEAIQEAKAILSGADFGSAA
jgi:hypothetical protein